jgi:cell division protein FtsL
MSSKPLSLICPRLWGREPYPQSWSVSARTATSLLLCILLLSLVGWLYLTQASQMTTTGYRMQDVAAEIEQLERDNALLRLQIAQLETLPRIEARAKQLGLGPINRPTYLTLSDNLWSTTRTAAVALTEPPPEEAPSQASEPGPEFALPSLTEFWEEVKTQVGIWAGQP